MNQGPLLWAWMLLAVLAANAPFIWQTSVLPLRGPKTLPWRLCELVLAYFAVGLLALWLEQRAGQVAPQGWEFYAITATLFLTLAFPGFVYRYLYKRHA